MEINVDWRREPSRVWPEVSYELRPLRVWAFQALLDRWEGLRDAAAPAPEDGGALSAAGETPWGRGGEHSLLALAARIFPDHVRRLEGLTLNRDGQTLPASPEMLGEEALLL
ncbi:MAG: hypothetical protein OEW39_06275, partial [Deltaproteobacteria bacterium]|nr:hypothetical protein [Deltaproteobacteria bacterium]